MKTISKLADLADYGIYPLTGEADSLSYRILCDVDERGKRIVELTYGMQCTAEPWNSSTNGNEHVASIMLPYRAWQDIGPMCLIESVSVHTIMETDDGNLWGFENDEEFRQHDEGAEYRCNAEQSCWYPWPYCYGKPKRFYGQGRGPQADYRNEHAASGRIM